MSKRRRAAASLWPEFAVARIRCGPNSLWPEFAVAPHHPLRSRLVTRSHNPVLQRLEP